MMGVGAKRAIGLYRSCAPRHYAAAGRYPHFGFVPTTNSLISAMTRGRSSSLFKESPRLARLMLAVAFAVDPYFAHRPGHLEGVGLGDANADLSHRGGGQVYVKACALRLA